MEEARGLVSVACFAYRRIDNIRPHVSRTSDNTHYLFPLVVFFKYADNVIIKPFLLGQSVVIQNQTLFTLSIIPYNLFIISPLINALNVFPV